MATADTIKREVKEIQDHYNVNINNKYVKSALLRMEVPSHISQNKDFLLKGELYYIDSRGAVEDLYMGVQATLDYIDLIVKNVMPQLVFNGADFVAKDQNEKILAQMVFKNFPANIDLFRDKVRAFFFIVHDYDINQFKDNPVCNNLKNYENLRERCMQEM